MSTVVDVYVVCLYMVGVSYGPEQALPPNTKPPQPPNNKTSPLLHIGTILGGFSIGGLGGFSIRGKGLVLSGLPWLPFLRP